jgi:PPP family 3-phenylpropionic acid transporter
MENRRSLLTAKSFYFFYYAGWACLSPFLALYYRQLGFSGGQIGLLTGISPLATMVAASFWGGVADATQRHRAVLLSAVAGAWLAVLALSQAHSFWTLIPIVAAVAFFTAPIIPLIDHSTLALLGEKRDQYGRQRLWGAIGWGAAGPIAGWLVGQFGLLAAFPAYLTLALFTFLAGWRLKVAGTEKAGPFWSGVRGILSDRRWHLFLLVIFISGTGLSIVTNYLFLFMAELHASAALMGLALACATLSEIPVLFFSSWMVRRWGARGVLIISLAAYVLRALGYSAATQPWQAVALQLFHGLSFSAMWVAGVSYANQIAPQGLKATALGLFSSTVMGLGGFAGAMLGGVLLDQFGGAGIFRVSAAAVLAGLLLFVLAGRETRPAGSES